MIWFNKGSLELSWKKKEKIICS